MAGWLAGTWHASRLSSRQPWHLAPLACRVTVPRCRRQRGAGPQTRRSPSRGASRRGGCVGVVLGWARQATALRPCRFDRRCRGLEPPRSHGAFECRRRAPRPRSGRINRALLRGGGDGGDGRGDGGDAGSAVAPLHHMHLFLHNLCRCAVRRRGPPRASSTPTKSFFAGGPSRAPWA